MKVSDLIAVFINEQLDNADGCAELQRAMIATRFRCVPSQINYVIATRFSPEHGFAVESRRGGGGYIRIRKVSFGSIQLMMHTVNAIGDEIDFNTSMAFLSNLVDSGALKKDSANLMIAAVSDAAMRTLPHQLRDSQRAAVLKQMLIHCTEQGVE